MSWYITAGKLIFQGVTKFIAHKGVQGVVGTVASGVLVDRFVTKAKEDRARKDSTDVTIDYLKKRIDDLEKELKKRNQK